MYVIFPTLIVSILPYVVGVIVFVIVCWSVGNFTGTYVLKSITIGLIVLLWAGINT